MGLAIGSEEVGGLAFGGVEVGGIAIGGTLVWERYTYGVLWVSLVPRPDRFNLQWMEVAGATEYEVEWQRLGATSWTSERVTGLAPIAPIHTVRSGLGTFNVRVRALVGGVWSNWSEVRQITVTQRYELSRTLARPQVSYFISGERGILNWNRVPNAQRYGIRYLALDGAELASFTRTGLTLQTGDRPRAGGRYVAQIRVRAEAHGWNPSPEATVVILQS